MNYVLAIIILINRISPRYFQYFDLMLDGVPLNVTCHTLETIQNLAYTSRFGLKGENSHLDQYLHIC